MRLTKREIEIKEAEMIARWTNQNIELLRFSIEQNQKIIRKLLNNKYSRKRIAQTINKDTHIKNMTITLLSTQILVIKKWIECNKD